RQNGPGQSLAFSPDGKLLASGGNPVLVWDADTGKPIRRLQGPSDDFLGWDSSVAFTPDGKALAASGPGGVVFWDSATGKVLRTEPAPPELAGGDEGTRSTISFPQPVQLSPDAKWLARVERDGSVRGWDTATLKDPRRITLERGRATVAQFSPDGKLLAVLGGNPKDSVAGVWDLTTGKPLGRMIGERAILAPFPD